MARLPAAPDRNSMLMPTFVSIAGLSGRPEIVADIPLIGPQNHSR